MNRNDFHRGLLEFIADNGRVPTIREIQSAMGISSTSMVSYYMGKLQAEGVLPKAHAGARAALMPVALVEVVRERAAELLRDVEASTGGDA